jgi:hypothetical protein
VREITMARMAQNATDARRAGDIRTAEYWEQRVEAESLRLEREQWANEWACLKGSPEHG